MKKKRTSFETAEKICMEFFGEAQTLTTLINLWREYVTNWKYWEVRSKDNGFKCFLEANAFEINA